LEGWPCPRDGLPPHSLRGKKFPGGPRACQKGISGKKFRIGNIVAKAEIANGGEGSEKLENKAKPLPKVSMGEQDASKGRR